MKIYCASDLHLGYERADYDAISAFFELVRKNADTLILCGDIFDLWRYPIDKIYKATLPGFKDCIEELRLTAIKVPVTIVPGNHDYNLAKLWPKSERGADISVSNEFAHEGIFFTHGWQFDVQQRRYSWAYGWLVTRFPYIYQKYMKKPVYMGMGKNDFMTPQIRAINDAAHRFGVKNKHKYVIMGHTHFPGIVPHGPKAKYGRVMNCGDFVDSCSYVVIEDGRPEVRYI